MVANNKTRRRYKSQTNEQFRELGRFVQEFELMVQEVRTLCLRVATNGYNLMRTSIILHNHSMTAAAIMEATAGVIGELLKEAKYGRERKRDIIELTRQFRKEYMCLYELRNSMLHGTWMIGWAHPEQEDFSKLNVFHPKSDLDEGFSLQTKLPKNTEELKAITTRCIENRANINRLNAALVNEDTPIDRFFYKDGKTWIRR